MRLKPRFLLSPTERVQRNLADGSAIAAGTYTITAPLRITAQHGPIIRTTGRRVTLEWRGPALEPMFIVEECSLPSFRDMDVVIAQPCAAFMRVLRTGMGGLSRPSTGMHLKDVTVSGRGHLTNGVEFLALNDDANNEHAAFERFELFDFTNIGVRITHKQSKEHYFEHCRFGTTGAKVGVESVTGFNWDKGAIYGIDVPFKLVGGGGDRVSIRDVAAENCRRFLVQEHRTGDHWEILVDGATYRANFIADDGEWVQLHNVGPLNVVNCQVGGGTMPRVPVIGVHGPGTPTLCVRGNAFDAFGAYKVCPVRTAEGSKCVVDWGLNVYSKEADNPERTQTIGDWTPQAMVKK